MSATTNRMIMMRLAAGCAALSLLALTVVVVPGAAARQRTDAGTPLSHGPVGGVGFGTSLRGSAPAGNGTSAVAFDPSTDTIYAANGNNANGPNAGGNTVSVIDGRHCDARSVRGCKGPWPTVTVGNEPSSIAVDQVHHTVYVTNNSDNTVSVINGATCNGRVTSGCGHTPVTIPVGALPVGSFVDEVTHTLYVANFDDGTVSIIDTASCNGTHPDGCPAAPGPTAAFGDGPNDVDVNQATHTGYVSTLTGVTAFDTRTCNAITTTGCGQVGVFTLCTACVGPFFAEVDVTTNTIYTGDGDTSVVAIDGRACNAGNLSECAAAPFGEVTLPPVFFEHIISLVVDTRLRTAYAVMQKNDAVIAIDLRVCNGSALAGCQTLRPQQLHTGADPESITLDRRTQTLYVANQVDGTISVLDATRCNARVTFGCRQRPPSAAVPGASGIAVDETVNTAYVASDNNTITMLDTKRCNAFHTDGCGSAALTATVGDGPTAIAVDEPNHTAYVANGGAGGSGSVSVLDTRTCNANNPGCAISATIAVPAGHPSGIAVNATTHSIYVATATSSGSNVVSVVNGVACNAVTTTGCSQIPASMTVGPSNGCSFVAVAVNEASNTIYATSSQHPGNSDCGPATLGTEVYVYDGTVCGATTTAGCGAALATVTAGSDPSGIAVDDATNTIYVPLLADGEHAGTVAVIDGSACNGTNTAGCDQAPTIAPVGFGPVGAAVDPTTHHVYVTNVEDTSVSVIDGKHCNGATATDCNPSVPQKLSVDDYPFGVAVASRAGTAYVTSAIKGTVSVVRLSPGS